MRGLPTVRDGELGHGGRVLSSRNFNSPGPASRLVGSLGGGSPGADTFTQTSAPITPSGPASGQMCSGMDRDMDPQIA